MSFQTDTHSLFLKIFYHFGILVFGTAFALISSQLLVKFSAIKLSSIPFILIILLIFILIGVYVTKNIFLSIYTTIPILYIFFQWLQEKVTGKATIHIQNKED